MRDLETVWDFQSHCGDDLVISWGGEEAQCSTGVDDGAAVASVWVENPDIRIDWEWNIVQIYSGDVDVVECGGDWVG